MAFNRNLCGQGEGYTVILFTKSFNSFVTAGLLRKKNIGRKAHDHQFVFVLFIQSMQFFELGCKTALAGSIYNQDLLPLKSAK